jgi:hypothetical protein
MSDSFARSIENLKLDDEFLNNHNSDVVSDIELPKNIVSTSFQQSDDGKYLKNTDEIDANVEKDVNRRQSENDIYVQEVKDFEDVAQISDNKIISISTQINEKKQLIIDKIAEASGYGCKIGIGTSGTPSAAVVNGIVLGKTDSGLTTSIITQDFPYIDKYEGLDDVNADVPFKSDDRVLLSSNNTGKGYASGLGINEGGVVGTYYVIGIGTVMLGVGTAQCAQCTAEIEQAAADIDDLRSQINQSLIEETNKIKDRKTASEVFVWGYGSRDSKISSSKSDNKNAIDTLNGMQ